MHLPDKTFPNSILAETTLHLVFVANTYVLAITATINTTEYPKTAAVFASMTDLVARQTVT